jgi:hypothetical protein
MGQSVQDGRLQLARRPCPYRAAEALFTTKRQITKQSVSDSLPSVDQSVRIPRMLKASSPALVRHEESEAPVASGEQITPEIPRSQFARIRAWVKYGMTTAQVAGVYGVAVDVIERILTKG